MRQDARNAKTGIKIPPAYLHPIPTWALPCLTQLDFVGQNLKGCLEVS
jgi:hypothetical protein